MEHVLITQIWTNGLCYINHIFGVCFTELGFKSDSLFIWKKGNGGVLKQEFVCAGDVIT